jgi:TolB-like protein/Flp pilus assembly protein TadD
MLGQTLGHFRILEKIGSGGMGEVYRAQDERLQRDVAIKVLPAGALADETARKRFRKEALALSKLNHPNIETLHEFGTEGAVDFLVMEYVAGTTLSDMLTGGPLPEKEIIRLGAQLAEGLAAAHQQNVVHRDLKPSNLRVTLDGRLKILDFGLAKLFPPPGEVAATDSLSETGAAAGTLPYMAPEQVSGAPPDPRSDIYAAGAVLYEMATSQQLFPRDREPLRLLYAILHTPPRPPSASNFRISGGLEAIVLKCLEKEPDHRYQSTREMLADLRRLSAGSTAVAIGRRRASFPPWLFAILTLGIVAGLVFWLVPGRWREAMPGNSALPIRSLAVLPLENLSGGHEQDYFADGMTDALITNLGQIRALRVISRTSIMRYKFERKPLGDIAKELSLDAVVEGSVLRSGTRVQITARLIQATTDTQIWSKTYERDLSDILRLQSDVARAIADEIRIQVTPEENARISRPRKVKPEAFDAYLKGRYHWEKRTREDLVKSLEFFQQAIRMDPTYAQAYAGLADSYAVLGNNQYLRPDDSFPKAKAAALKALEIDDGLAEAHTSLAFTLWNYEVDGASAERDFKRAIGLNPGYATAHHWYAGFLSGMGRHEEAVAEIRKARELDPLSPRINANVGFILYFARKYDQAIAELQKALEMDPSDGTAYLYLGMVYTQKGNHEQAITVLVKYGQLPGNSPLSDLEIAYSQAMAGHREKAEDLLRRLLSESKGSYIPPYSIARVYAALGQKKHALGWLEKAYEERAPQLAFLNVDPRLDPLRSDPEFRALLRRTKLKR